MASNRRKRQKAKQQRHRPAETPQATSADLESKSSPSAEPQVKRSVKTKPRGKKSSVTNQKNSPLTSSGVLDWSSVNLHLPVKKSTQSPPALTSSQLLHPGLGIFSVVMCLIGITLTGRWSLLLLAVLAAVLMIDPRVRMNKNLLVRCAVGSVLAIACLPLVSRLPENLPNLNESLLGSGVLIMFSISLWLIGNAARRVASMQDRPFPQVGLYSIGMACQVLCVIVVLLGAVLITLAVNNSI